MCSLPWLLLRFGGLVLCITFVTLDTGPLGAVGAVFAVFGGLGRGALWGDGLVCGSLLGLLRAGMVRFLVRGLILVMSPNLFLLRVTSATWACISSGLTDRLHWLPSCVRGAHLALHPA